MEVTFPESRAERRERSIGSIGRKSRDHPSSEQSKSKQALLEKPTSRPSPGDQDLPVFGSTFSATADVTFKLPGSLNVGWSDTLEANTVWEIDARNARLYSNTFHRSSRPNNPSSGPNRAPHSGDNTVGVDADVRVTYGFFGGFGSARGFALPGRALGISLPMGSYGSIGLVALRSASDSGERFRGLAILYSPGGLRRFGRLRDLPTLICDSTEVDLGDSPKRHDLRFDLHLRRAFDEAYGTSLVEQSRGF